MTTATLSATRWRRFAAAACIVVVGAAGGGLAASSQPSPGQHLPAAFPNPLTVLLRAESVHRELGLTEGQLDALQEALDEAELSLWQARDLPVEERVRTTRIPVKRLRDALIRNLTPRQLERFDQIVHQTRGIETLLAPDVAERLKLTIAQRDKIRATLKTLGEQSKALRQRDPTIRPQYARGLREKAQRDILSVLQQSQRRAYLTLLGQAFDLTQVRRRACPAPEFEDVTTWIHSDPLKLQSLRGKVVVVHFYTFGCINCIRNLPHYNDWRGRFDSNLVAVIGIHRPETQREYDIEAVRGKAAEIGITYPIAVDNDSVNWDAWANHTWPSLYLTDKEGYVRIWWYGELNWKDAKGEAWMRNAITKLLDEEQ